MEMAELYDAEVKEIAAIWNSLNREWSSKPNTRENLQEFAKVGNDAFLKAGFVVNIMWENTLIINPATMQAYPIEIEILGRVTGMTGGGVLEEGHVLMDHERKRDEVLKANERGERFFGQKN